jgi:hypothetical protein
MSDQSPVRPETDPAARVARDLRERLCNLPHAELVELAAQLTTTYVIEGVQPLGRASEGADLAADSAGEETFAQLLKRLKAQRRDPVLERFLIDGENISVRIDGYGVLPVTEYRRPIAPPPGPGVSVQTATVRVPAAPGAASNPYNRALYQPEAPPPVRSTPQPAAQSQAAPRPVSQPAPQLPAGAQPGAAGQPKKDPEGKDRFTLIEID